MSLPTPPHTSHRGDKENRFANPGSRVVWSSQHRYHSLSSPPKGCTILSALRELPVKSILKKSNYELLPPPLEDQREVTPEPSDPLVDLNYLVYPVSKILALDASLRDLIEGYSILAARLRACVTGSTDTDASWPLFQPLRKNSSAFVDAVVRDLGRALVDPATERSTEEEEGRKEDAFRFSLPSPKSSPTKKKQGMSAEQVKCARDLCTTTHSVLKLLSCMLSLPAIYNIFDVRQLQNIMTAVLAIPLADELPTPNARKTCALSIWLLQVQRLPSDVLTPASDRMAYALRRGLDGELGKEGKKGSVSDGLKAIHDLCIYQPSTFVPSFITLLPSILANLLAPTLALRTQACHALGGFVIGSTSLPQSYLHTRIANTVASFITKIPAASKKSPTKSTEAPILRTLRTTLNVAEPTHVANGPVWALSVLASFVVLLGPMLCTNEKVIRSITPLLSLPMRHPKSAVRALNCLIWRPVAWAYFQPPLMSDSDAESEVEQDGDMGRMDKGSKEKVCRKAYWKVVESMVDLQSGMSTIAGLTEESYFEGEEEGLRKAIGMLKAMVNKSGQTCGDAMESMKQMVSFETVQEGAEEWSLNKLLPYGLFSSSPGLLTVEFKNLVNVMRSLYEQVPTAEDVRSLTREEIARDWVWDGFIDVWRRALGQLEMGDEADLPSDLVAVWDGLMKANVGVLQESANHVATSEFAMKAAEVLVEIIQDANLDLTPKAPSLTFARSCGDDSEELPTTKIEGPVTHTNGFLKLKVVRGLWTVMRTVFPHAQLNEAAETMLACLMKNEDELVDSNKTARSAWTSLCVEILVVCDVDAVRAFWGYEIGDGERPWVWSWTEDVKGAVWKTFAKKWKETEGHWEGAVIVLGVPFTETNQWTLCNKSSSRWVELLEFTVSKALDYGVDSVTVLDNVASFVSQNQTPISSSCTRVADLLLSHLNMADAREIPEAVMEFVNETMRSTYPPEPRNKAEGLWMAGSLANVIDKCPLELCARLLELIEEGMCLWISDDYRSWAPEELSYTILRLYENTLLRIQDLPAEIKILEKLAPILRSAFCGRSEMVTLASEPFRIYWEITYSRIPVPKEGWPRKIEDCLRVAVDCTNDIAVQEQEDQPTLDCILQPVYGASSSEAKLLAGSKKNQLVTEDLSPASQPSVLCDPTTPVAASMHLSSPPRPHKSSVSIFETFPFHQSPSSPVRARIQSACPPTTPKRTPTHSSIYSQSTGGSGSPGKRRKMDLADKENESPLRRVHVASVTERIAMQSPLNSRTKPFALGKRAFDEACDADDIMPFSLKRVRMGINGSSSPTPSTSSSNDSEDERRVAATLLDASPMPFPSLGDVFSSVVTAPSTMHSKKRKRTIMEAVVVPTLQQVNQRRLGHTSSLDSLESAPKMLTRSMFTRVLKSRSVSNTEKRTHDTLPGRRRSSDPFGPSSPMPLKGEQCIRVIRRPAIITSPSRSSELSSDDDPHLGQVTPHHLISPALRKTHHLSGEDTYDPPSDDPILSSSPLKEMVSRRLTRSRSLQKISLLS